MKTKNYFFLLAMNVLVSTGCSYSEDSLEPSGVKTSYQVPQGIHDYDQVIVNFYQKYGSYLLYKFSDKDAYWTPSGWVYGKATTESDAGQTGYAVTPADENYVGQQLELINKAWFSRYNDKILSKLLPVKILLCSEIDSMKTTYVFSPSFHMEFAPVPVGARCNYDNIAVSYGNSNVVNANEPTVRYLASKIARAWTEYMMTYKITPTAEFSSSVDYSSSSSIRKLYAPKDCCAAGITSVGYNATALNDWKHFMLMLMCYSYQYLTEDPGDISSWSSWSSDYYWTESTDYHGILNAKKDTKGLLMKRYKTVRQFFIDNYDIDLQTVGNQL